MYEEWEGEERAERKTKMDADLYLGIPSTCIIPCGYIQIYGMVYND